MSNAEQGPQGKVSPRARRAKHLITAVVILAAAVVAVAFVLKLSGPRPRYFSRHIDLDAVAYPDAGHGWVIGDVYNAGGFSITGGAIHVTKNGGVTWHEEESATTWCSPSEVAFADARCGWVLGSSQPANNAPPADPNVVLATTDGGASWTRQDTGTSGTDYELSDFACANDMHAWAAGGGGTQKGVILATTDGGAFWKRQYLGEAGSLEAVAFADAHHGWAVGDRGLILATTDGGAAWKTQYSLARYDLTRVACASAAHAWAMGWDSSNNHAIILATTDGGTTWRLQYSSASVNLAGMAFADTTHGWAVGFGGVSLATTDGGQSWKPKHSGTTMDLLDVAFADTTHGLVVGHRTKGDDPLAAQLIGSIVLRTTDGGTTWTK